MFKVAVGHSEDPDSIDAIKEIIDQCEDVLQGAKPNAGILVAAPDYEHEAILKYITEKYPGIELVGCTSSGELSSNLGYMEGSLLLALFSTDRVKINAGVIRNLSKENYKEEVKKSMNTVLEQMDDEPRLCMAFPEVFTIGLVKVVKEMESVLGKDVPIVGAGATDMNFKFTENSQFYNTEVLHDSAPFLIFSGPLRYAIASSSGWEPFTSAKLIFQHKDNVVTKIGDFTALDFFKHYLGGAPTLSYPLAIFQDKQNEEAFFLRAAIGVDEDAGTVTFGADIPEIEMACSIAKADPEELIKVMRELVAKTNEIQPPFNFTFIASCACRQAVLGTKIRREAEVIQEAYSAENPSFGLYSYGQIGPLETGGQNQVHNETVVVVAIGEENGTG